MTMVDVTIPGWFVWIVAIFGTGAISWAGWMSLTLAGMRKTLEYIERDARENDEAHKAIWNALNDLRIKDSQLGESVAGIKARIHVKGDDSEIRKGRRDDPKSS